MLTAAFLRQRDAWTKPGGPAWLVEECIAAGRVLDVDRLVEPTPAGVRLVRVRTGVVEWSMFACPQCGRPRMSLYVPPDLRADAWACRRCHGLVYAGQRYKSRRHPLRRVLLPRTRKIRQRAVAKEAQRMVNQRTPKPAAEPPRAPIDEGLKGLVELAQARGGQVVLEVGPRGVRVESDAAREVRELLAAEAPRSAAVLRELSTKAKSAKVRAQAQASLKAQGLDRAPVRLSPRSIDLMKQALAEDSRGSDGRSVQSRRSPP